METAPPAPSMVTPAGNIGGILAADGIRIGAALQQNAKDLGATTVWRSRRRSGRAREMECGCTIAAAWPRGPQTGAQPRER
mmetsp:Transcript_17986/g.63183  ORF Transcript_17986/g.63183 Transcript_17986/m.63183 type:complete len:81 (-) Transcript_17986:22-264(-)